MVDEEKKPQEEPTPVSGEEEFLLSPSEAGSQEPVAPESEPETPPPAAEVKEGSQEPETGEPDPETSPPTAEAEKPPGLDFWNAPGGDEDAAEEEVFLGEPGADESLDFDLEGISLEEGAFSEAPDETPAQSSVEAPTPAETPTESSAPPPAGPVTPPGGEDSGAEEKPTGLPARARVLLALGRERLARIPRPYLALAATLLIVPILALGLVGLPAGEEPESGGKVLGTSEEGKPEAAKSPFVAEKATEKAAGKEVEVAADSWELARQEAERGKFKAAILLLRNFLGRKPLMLPEDLTDAYIDLYQWHRRIGEVKAADRFLDKAQMATHLAREPARLFAGGEDLYQAGMDFLRDGRHRKAIALFRKARVYLAAFRLLEGEMDPVMKKKLLLAYELLSKCYQYEAEAGERMAKGE